MQRSSSRKPRSDFRGADEGVPDWRAIPPAACGLSGGQLQTAAVLQRRTSIPAMYNTAAIPVVAEAEREMGRRVQDVLTPLQRRSSQKGAADGAFLMVGLHRKGRVALLSK